MTWNFPTQQGTDGGTGSSPRCDKGCGFEVKHSTTPLPFTSEITCIFSVLHWSDYAATDTANSLDAQFWMSIGAQSATDSNFYVYFDWAQGNGSEGIMVVTFYDSTTATYRHQAFYKEIGGGFLQSDVWHFYTISANGSGVTVAKNGQVISPTTTLHSNIGALHLDGGSAGNLRLWLHGPTAAWGAANANAITIHWPTLTFGPAAIDDSAVDLTSDTVLSRIYLGNGDLANPGQNGSLWFNDSYGTAPSIYLPSGQPRHDQGSSNLTWTVLAGASYDPYPGGLRLEYL